MKNHFLKFIGIALVLLCFSCGKLTEVTDVITQPTAREVYARNFDTDSVPYRLWTNAFQNALNDSLQISSPYQENGIFNPEIQPVYAYDLDLERGRSYAFSIQTDTLQPKVFIDLYEKTSDSIRPYKLVQQADYEASILDFSPKYSGTYKVLFQPELNTSSSFALRIQSKPSYYFPVSGASAKSIQSFWGAARDGGKRSHEGVDIFAKRGTPVVASVDGYISRTGNRGLGGKQVWLREGLFGNSLYYAHLDSIIATSGQRVKVGDTLGLVGNTGNARTTPPHLHFGVYSHGAINPLPFVKEEPELPALNASTEFYKTYAIKTAQANLRSSASAKSQKIGALSRKDTVRLLGKSADWLHIETSAAQRAFVHQSLVKAL